jgi:hypothetical protein
VGRGSEHRKCNARRRQEEEQQRSVNREGSLAVTGCKRHKSLSRHYIGGRRQFKHNFSNNGKNFDKVEKAEAGSGARLL